MNKKYKDMCLIGITGTNGKTTIATLLYKYLTFSKIKATLIGTNGIYINDEYIESINTTPSNDILNEVIERSHQKNIKYIIMEVSSHAIVQKRIKGLKFKIKLITNVTIDHLDYHHTFKKYRRTKLKFLNRGLYSQKIIINNDMDEIKYFKKYVMQDKEYYGFSVNGSNLKLYDYCSKFIFNYNDNKYVINTNLLGQYNCSNILGFLTILVNLDLFNYCNIKKFFNNSIEIPGRMNLIEKNSNKIFIDYAHTPDGMENVLSFLNKIKKENLYVLFGCGGNRDKTKRSLMMNVASKYADYIILTSDNPRNEEPETIINDILKNNNHNHKYKVILKREEAIKYALNLLQQNDLLAILGRGLDNYYCINDKKIYLNDYELVKEVINE